MHTIEQDYNEAVEGYKANGGQDVMFCKLISKPAAKKATNGLDRPNQFAHQAEGSVYSQATDMAHIGLVEITEVGTGEKMAKYKIGDKLQIVERLMTEFKEVYGRPDEVLISHYDVVVHYTKKD